MIRFFVEPTRHGWFYPCTVDDMCTVLALCPPEALLAFDFIVLRQPTRKQRILCPVWGRAIFHFDIDKYSGAAIVIEAQDLSPVRWRVSITAERARELDRLRQDGHTIRTTRRAIDILVTPHSLRNTVLYRTLLHELGHHVDYHRSSEEQWSGKTRTAKEDYAHRHARELYAQLSQHGALPFATIIDEASLASDGLQPAWFYLPSSRPSPEPRH